jgi:hypothetical protein
MLLGVFKYSQIEKTEHYLQSTSCTKIFAQFATPPRTLRPDERDAESPKHRRERKERAMLNKEQNAQVSDTTEANSIHVAGYLLIPSKKHLLALLLEHNNLSS